MFAVISTINFISDGHIGVWCSMRLVFLLLFNSQPEITFAAHVQSLPTSHKLSASIPYSMNTFVYEYFWMPSMLLMPLAFFYLPQNHILFYKPIVGCLTHALSASNEYELPSTHLETSRLLFFFGGGRLCCNSNRLKMSCLFKRSGAFLSSSAKRPHYSHSMWWPFSTLVSASACCFFFFIDTFFGEPNTECHLNTVCVT